MKKVILCLIVLFSTTFSQPIEFWGGCTSDMTVEDVQLLHPQGELVKSYYSKADYTRYVIRDLMICANPYDAKFQFDSLSNKLTFVKLECTIPSKSSFNAVLQLLVSKYGQPMITRSDVVIWIINGTEINLYFLYSKFQGIVYKPAPDTSLL